MKPKLHHLQLMLPRIERGEARVRIAAKIATRQISITAGESIAPARDCVHRLGSRYCRHVR